MACVSWVCALTVAPSRDKRVYSLTPEPLSAKKKQGSWEKSCSRAGSRTEQEELGTFQMPESLDAPPCRTGTRQDRETSSKARSTTSGVI